jgi:GntR family transcriptional regulator
MVRQTTSSSDISAPSRLRPRYAQLAESLFDGIYSGHYPVGMLLPTENELSAAHGVSRATVREALSQLEDRGLISRSQGVGTRVLTDRARTKYVLAGRADFGGTGYDEDTYLQVKQRRTIRATRPLATRLGVEPGSEWVHLQGVRCTQSGKGQPLCVSDLYVALPYAAILDTAQARTRPVYECVEATHGVVIAQVWQDVTAVTMTSRQARALRTAPGATGLHVLRRFLTKESVPIEVTVNVHPADRFTFSLRLDHA